MLSDPAAMAGRIESCRKADAAAVGFAPGSEVEVEQISHEFQFGANMFNFGQLGNPEANERYREAFKTVFNAATIPFYWKEFEPEKGFERFAPSQPCDREEFWNSFDFGKDDPYSQVAYRRPCTDPLVDFCEKNGISMHGHALIYMRYIPKWLDSAKWTKDDMARMMKAHIDSIAARYGSRLQQWDVVNESTGRTSTPDNPDDKDPWYTYYNKVKCPMPDDHTFKSFEWASAAFPDGVGLSINDAWPTNQCYAPLSKKLIDRGAKITIVGLQKHIFKPKQLLDAYRGKLDVLPSGTSWAPETQLKHLQELDKCGKPIHISEITLPSPRGIDGLSDEEADAIQAAMLERCYRLWFSWSSVYRITYWNVVDAMGAKSEKMSSGLFNRDMTEKAAWKTLRRLIKEEWSTRIKVKADRDGVIRFRGFKGKYKLKGRDLKGKAIEKTITVSKENEPVKIAGGDEWVPVKDMGPEGPVLGSALDFTSFADRSPCGTYGRVVCAGEHYEFEKLPGKPQRFYGVNLCFDANYPSHEEADRLVATLVKCGYNALRIHHHDGLLCPDPNDVTKTDSVKFDRLDYLIAACARSGMYITTDFYVNRRREMKVSFKQMLPVDKKLQEEQAQFIRIFLGRRNKYRGGMRYADDPTIAFAAIINEGNLGNYGFGVLADSPLWREAWGKKFPMNLRKNDALTQEFFRFLAEKEIEIFEKYKKIVREEMGSKILLSNMSCWTNPLIYQKPRLKFDYIEDHFYAEHPKWAGPRKWTTPMEVGNVRWFADNRVCSKLLNTHRLHDRPFMISESNFPAPAERHGLGGAVTGAWAALQDWDAIFHFAWAHQLSALTNPAKSRIGCFDISTDPAMQSGDRTAVALFLRGDMKPIKRRIAYHVPLKRLEKYEKGDPLYAWQGWSWVDWYVRTAVAMTDKVPSGWETFGSYPGWVWKSGPRMRNEMFGESVKKDEWPIAGDGQVRLEPKRGAFAYMTERSCGGFAEDGTVDAGAFKFEIGTKGPVTVGCISLDGKPIGESKRLLVSHVPEMQQTGTEFSDATKNILLKWGDVPRLVRAAKGKCTIAMPGSGVRVYALDFSGNRVREVQVDASASGKISFECNTAADRTSAACEYEVIRK